MVIIYKMVWNDWSTQTKISIYHQINVEDFRKKIDLFQKNWPELR